METTVDELRALADTGATILNVGKHGGHREIRGAIRYRPHDLLTPDHLAIPIAADKPVIRAVWPGDDPDAAEQGMRDLLGRFGLTGDQVYQRVGALSGGEKSRAALARLVALGVNVLVLDEPTNHLDIASRDALEAVLHDFGGTLLFVSHDRYLIDSLARFLWVVSDGRLLRYEGTYSALAAG